MKIINHNIASKELFKNTGIIAIGQISTKVLNFLLLPLYTALLSVEEYGILDLLSTYTSFIVVIVGLQMNQAVFRFLIPNRKSDKKVTEMVTTVVEATVVVIIIYTVLFCAIQSLLTLHFKWYLLVQVITTIYLQTVSGISRGLGCNSVYAIGNFLSAAITLIMNVIVIAGFKLGIGAMLISYIVGPLVGGTFILFKSRVLHYISFSRVYIDELKNIIKYSLPLIPNELSWSLIHSSDRLIVSYVLTVMANGLIAVASKFSLIYTTLFSIFNASWTEQVILHYNDEGGAEYISDMFDKMITLFGTIAIAIIAVMPLVFDIFVNKRFSAAYSLIPLYMIAVFFNTVIGMISAIYLVKNETRNVAISTMCAAIINIVVDIVLIRYIDVYAAPISSICGYAVISFWRLFDVNQRHCKIVMRKGNLGFLLLALFIALCSFYSGLLIINILVLVLLIIITGIVNKNFVKDIVDILKLFIGSHSSLKK